MFEEEVVEVVKFLVYDKVFYALKDFQERETLFNFVELYKV